MSAPKSWGRRCGVSLVISFLEEEHGYSLFEFIQIQDVEYSIDYVKPSSRIYFRNEYLFTL